MLRQIIIPIGPSIAYVPLTRGQYALIDREDAQWAGRWNWHTRKSSSGTYYAARSVAPRGEEHFRLFMHTELLGPSSSGLTADHLMTRNGLDNRRSNLRPANKSEQARTTQPDSRA